MPAAKLFAYYLLPGATVWVWQPIVVDAPIALTLDSSGQAHLSVPPSPNFADAEVPAAIDGGTFRLAHAPNPPASLMLHRNGMLLTAGVDYLLTANTLDWVVLEPGDSLIAFYRF